MTGTGQKPIMMVEAGCIGHARRKLVDLVRAKGSPIASEGLWCINQA